MPRHEEHCQDSLTKYGKRFDALHKWMDEPSTILGKKHRIYRHNPYETPKKAKKLFGEFADDACLDHIRLDRTPVSKWIMPPPRKKDVDLEDTRIALQNSFKEMFQIIEEFPKLANWKQETKVQKKPKSGLGIWFHILLLLAAAWYQT